MKQFMSGSKQKGKGIMSTMFKKLLLGLGTAVFTYIIVPRMRNMVEPIVEKGMDEVKSMAERGKQTIEEYKSRKYNTFDMVKDPVSERAEEGRDVISDKINVLQETLDKLKNEISKLRKKE